MSFNCVHGNSEHNFYIDHACIRQLDQLERFRPKDFVGEATVFIHEFQGKFCLYTGSALQVYPPDFTSGKVIGALPPGDSVLFTAEGLWASHQGPLRKYDKDFKPILEEYIVPHGGPWTSSLGVFAVDDSLFMAYSFCGGPREWTPELQLNTATPSLSGAGKSTLTGVRNFSRPGDVESMVQLEKKLYAAGEKGLSIFSAMGVFQKEIPLEQGISHLAASKEQQRVGGFCLKDSRWSYREFDAEGVEVFSHGLPGATAAGYVVFDPEGARYLMSNKRLIKIGADGNWLWSKSLKSSVEQAPRFLVYQEGYCAYVEEDTLVLLDPQGIVSQQIPLGTKDISSPPYLDVHGSFWIGLQKQTHKLMKVSFKS